MFFLGIVQHQAKPDPLARQLAIGQAAHAGEGGGQTGLRITFGLERDEGAPEYPLILAITYPDRATMLAALDHPVRLESRAATRAATAGRFEGRIHHHVTKMLDFPA